LYASATSTLLVFDGWGMGLAAQMLGLSPKLQNDAAPTREFAKGGFRPLRNAKTIITLLSMGVRPPDKLADQPLLVVDGAFVSGPPTQVPPDRGNN
jgi:hypothetical protein